MRSETIENMHQKLPSYVVHVVVSFFGRILFFLALMSSFYLIICYFFILTISRLRVRLQPAEKGTARRFPFGRNQPLSIPWIPESLEVCSELISLSPLPQFNKV